MRSPRAVEDPRRRTSVHRDHEKGRPLLVVTAGNDARAVRRPVNGALAGCAIDLEGRSQGLHVGAITRHDREVPLSLLPDDDREPAVARYGCRLG
jgi:hypothetical protein